MPFVSLLNVHPQQLHLSNSFSSSNKVKSKKTRKETKQSIWRWCWTFWFSNLIKTNAAKFNYHNIFDYYSSWKDQRTQPGSDHWKSMHHFGQCTTVLLSTKHFCGVLSYTKLLWCTFPQNFCTLNTFAVYRWTLNTSMIVCICTLTQMH